MGIRMRYLVIRESDGFIINVIIHDGVSSYTPDNGFYLYKESDAPAGAGMHWTFIDGVWVEPPVETE